MATRRRRRPWGSVRELPSGRFQVRYLVDGQWHTGSTTFLTRREADGFLATVRTDLGRGAWVNPESGKTKLLDYALLWLRERPNLRPRTRELYETNLRLHIFPKLGNTELAKLTPIRVRSWHAGLIEAGKPGAPTVAKCYRLLHAILATAVEDELIVKNPCVLKRASQDRSEERPVATVQQVFALANTIQPRMRAMVLMATFTGLRLGELRALTRARIDLLHRTVRVVEQYQDLANGTVVLGPPKSDAGRRTVAIPDALMPELEAHLEQWAAPGKTGLVFCGTQNQPLNRKTFYRSWNAATKDAGMEGFHFHDLRHTGNTLAAATGASTKELMVRMGHSSPRAALIYQHATQDRDAAIAKALSDLLASNGYSAPVSDLEAKRQHRQRQSTGRAARKH